MPLPAKFSFNYAGIKMTAFCVVATSRLDNQLRPCFLHETRPIRCMLLMGWGGKCATMMELTSRLHHEMRRLRKEIEALGMIHQDLRLETIFRNEELIIDVHCVLKFLTTIGRQLQPVKWSASVVDIGPAKHFMMT